MLKTKELDTAKIRILVEILNMGIVNSSSMASHSFLPPWSKEAKKKKAGEEATMKEKMVKLNNIRLKSSKKKCI